MHAKTMVVDGVWAEEIFQADLKHSKKIGYEEWNSRSILERLFEFFTFPVKELL